MFRHFPTHRAASRSMGFTLIAFFLFAAAALGACQTAPAAPPEATEPIVANTATPLPEPTEAPTPAPPQPIHLTDGSGRDFELAQPATRIISMAPSNTEILFAIGAGDLLVGRDDISDYPAEALDVESIGSTYGELNLEAIVALRPDLVLAASITSPEQIQAMEDLDLPVFVLANPMTFDDLYANLKLVGALTGHSDDAAQLVESLKERVQAALDALEGAEAVRVFYEVDGSDPTAPWTTGSGTFQEVLIGMAHGENIAAEIEGWGQMSLEEIVARDPQVILFASGPWVPTTIESLAARAGWGDLDAVRNGRIYAIDTNLVDRPGPRLVDGFEAFARALHPERFP